MRKLLLAASAAFAMAVPVAADEIPLIPKDGGYGNTAGERIVLTTADATSAFDAEFTFNAVRVCIDQGGRGRGPVYFRLGTTMTTSLGEMRPSQTGALVQTIFSTTAEHFRTGSTSEGAKSGPAAVLGAFVTRASATGTATPETVGETCTVMPIRHRGMIFQASSPVTIDVMAFGNAK